MLLYWHGFDIVLSITFCKFSSIFSDYADFWSIVCQKLKDVKGALKLVEEVKEMLNELETISPQKRLIQQIILVILNLQYPKEIGPLATEVNIPLLGLETPDEVVSYVDAVIRSGTLVDEKSGTVFLMGNTAHCVLNYDQFKLEIFNPSFVTTVSDVHVVLFSLILLLV